MKIYNRLVNLLGNLAVRLGNLKVQKLQEDNENLAKYADTATILVHEYKRTIEALNNGYSLLQDETDKLNRKHSVTIACLLSASGGAITVPYAIVDDVAEKEFAIDFLDSPDGSSVTLSLGFVKEGFDSLEQEENALPEEDEEVDELDEAEEEEVFDDK